MDEFKQQEQRFLQWMCRHFVALSAFYDCDGDDGERKRRLVVFSGFTMILHERLYWVTAGHCLEALDSLMQDPKVEVSEIAFADYFGLDAKDRHDVPFSYAPGTALVVHDADAQFDFALLPVPPLICSAFIANGIKATSRANWEKQPELDFTFYRLLGVPADYVGLSRSADGTFERHMTPFAPFVEKVNRNEITNPPPDRWLIGRIHPDAAINDIAGMSGGPIFGFRKTDDGQWSYHFCGVQSRWREKSRIILGCSLPLFGELLHHALAE